MTIFSSETVIIHQMLAQQATLTPHATAIAAPGRASLSYQQLFSQFTEVAATLASMGIGLGKRVGIVLPSSPELAVAILAISACATSVPLNPAYNVAEFEAYFRDTSIDAVIVLAGEASPAIAAAHNCQIPVIQLHPDLRAAAGTFRLTATTLLEQVAVSYATATDIALILHTSGTTSRSKIVPLSHANIYAASQNVIAALELGPSDRCLSVMPLFHSQGLIAGLIASLYAGGSVACAPPFDAAQFYLWLDELRPTWYTAVPTIHQAVLSTAKQYPDILARCSLRAIRSASASLPVPVFRDLETTFNVKVIEGYGLTEAFQITSNRISRPQKVRSVGLPVGTQIAIIDADGKFLPPGAVGEVVTKGDNVMQGYENNPQANATVFLDGWLRTGDQGYIDDEGYLFLTGRLKELINRGGEKITPLEVEEALLEHPHVAEAVAFAVPHPRLGEDVAAAVVVKPGVTVTGRSLREFLATQLAEFKVPNQIVLLPEIPKSSTGKFKRSELAATLKNQLQTAYVAPTHDLEVQLVQVWQQTLQTESIGIDDNFFSLGGDSLQAVQLIAAIEQQLQRQLPNDALFQAPTIRQLAELMQQLGSATTWDSLITIESSGSCTPLFLIHDVEGETILYRTLALQLAPERPVYALRPLGREGFPILQTRISEMVDHYLAQIQQVQPHGPYLLGGLCAGGVLAYAIALKLEAQGETADVFLFDAADPKAAKHSPHQQRLQRLTARLQEVQHTSKLEKMLSTARVVLTKARNLTTYLVRSHWQRLQTYTRISILRFCLDRHLPLPYFLRQLSVRQVYRYAIREFLPARLCRSRLILFRATEKLITDLPGIDDEPFRNLYSDPLLGWGSRSVQPVQVFDVPGGHSSMLQEPQVQILAEKMQACLQPALKVDSSVSLRQRPLANALSRGC